MMTNPYMGGATPAYPYGVPSGAMPGYMPSGQFPSGYAYPPYTPGAGTYFPGAPQFPGQIPPGQVTQPSPPGQLPLEQSYIENILRLNLGKIATVYMTFENNTQWNAKVFRGNIEAAGRDHIILSDPQTGMRYLLLMVNLDYITFEEELNYAYPFA